MEAKKFIIKKNLYLTDKLFLLELEGTFSQKPHPGQFIHIKIEPFFLRRPFSIAGYKEGFLKVLYRTTGRATDVLKAKKEGEVLDIIGPLGRGFPVKNSQKNVYLVGGGTGIAPLLFLSEELLKNNLHTTFFYGAKTTKEIVFNILPYGVSYIFSTDDGSYGNKGVVSKVMERYIKKGEIPDVIYAGGPYEMLKKIAEISEKWNIPAFVSMENRMACGTGICYGCVTKIKSKKGWEYKRVCKDGPVFNSKEVLWE